MIKVLVVAVVLAACGGGKKESSEPKTASNDDALSNKQPDTTPPPPPPQTPTERALAAMGDFEQKMCACKDAECAKRVSDEMTSWSQAEAQKQKEPVKMSDEDMKRAVEIGTHMGECMQKAMGVGSSQP
jgi:hypothetical protein